jgi:hypothetical protein
MEVVGGLEFPALLELGNESRVEFEGFVGLEGFCMEEGEVLFSCSSSSSSRSSDSCSSSSFSVFAAPFLLDGTAAEPFFGFEEVETDSCFLVDVALESLRLGMLRGSLSELVKFQVCLMCQRKNQHSKAQ